MTDFTFSAKASADLSAHQYTLMRLGAASVINVASEDVNSALCGVLITKPKSGEFGTVQYGGLCYVMAGAAITAPATFTTNGSGRAVTAASGDMVAGRVMESAGADGDIVQAILMPPVRWAGAV